MRSFFRIVSQIVIIIIFLFIFPCIFEFHTQAATSQDFVVIRGTSVISSGKNVTITEGTDYSLESGVTINDAFIRITNTRFTGMGNTSGGGSQNIKDYIAIIDDPENLLTSITFARPGVSGTTRIDWEIIQYVGSSGGDNEIIVRNVERVATSGNTNNVLGTTVTTISDVNKVAVFITSQGINISNSTGWAGFLFTSELVANGSDWDPKMTRGYTGTAAGTVSYAVVEFTGSNWRDVTRDEFTTTATAWDTSNTGNSSTVSISTSLLDSSKAFIHAQYSIDQIPIYVDDAGDVVELSASTTNYTLRNRSTSGTRKKVVWVIENTQSGEGAMEVQHVSFYDSTTSGSEERSFTQSITAVNSLDNASIFGESASVDSSSSVAPIGSINVRLTATDTITYTESENSEERRIGTDVVQWPETVLPVAISLSTDGSVDFGNMAENATQDSTASGINDVETISVDTGPADLDIKSTTFSYMANTWALGSSNGSDQVKWEFSKNGTAWSTFLVADTLYTLESNVSHGGTQNFYLRLTTPTSSTAYDEYSTSVTVVATSP